MLFAYILGVCLLILLVFSFSKETGKNTKFARKGAKNQGVIKVKPSTIDTSHTIEIN